MKLLSKTKEIFEAWAISFNPNDAQAELASKRIEICDVCEYKAVDPYIHCRNEEGGEGLLRSQPHIKGRQFL